MELINWRLISHPLNWVEIFLMIFIGLIALQLFSQYLSNQPVSGV